MKLFLIIFVLTFWQIGNVHPKSKDISALLLPDNSRIQNERIIVMPHLTEIWKPIKGTDNHYEVSNYGEIRSTNFTIMRSNGKRMTIKSKIRKCHLDTVGYYQITLRSGDTKLVNRQKIHTLVWDAFGNRPRNGRILMVDHIDGDRLNNRIDNLQLLNNRENCAKGKIRDLPTGVYRAKEKYLSSIRIGTYDTPEEASFAYQKVAEYVDTILKDGYK